MVINFIDYYFINFVKNTFFYYNFNILIKELSTFKFANLMPKQ